MQPAKSGNHEVSAFSPDPIASSRNPGATTQAFAGAPHVAWALVLFVWVMLHGSVLVDEAAFERVGRRLDGPCAVWVEAVTGYAGVAYLTVALRRSTPSPRLAKRHLVSSLAAVLGYGFHLYALRWPWLTGAALAGSRLDRWAGTLSSTWRGMPLVALGEVLGLVAVLVHGYLGLSLAAPYAKLKRVNPNVGRGAAALFIAAAAVVGGAIVAIATGRR